MNGLRNAQAKLAWAEGHLQLLDREIESFSHSNPYTLVRHDDTENQRHILRFKLLDVPDVICLIAADAVYNMRTCLDQMVWGLAKLSGSIPKRTAFPILDGPALTKPRLESFNNWLTGVPSEAVCEIAALQPYHRGASYKTHPLWRLNEICNLDKHRRIPANGSEAIVYFPNLTPCDRKLVASESTDDCFVISVPIALKGKLDFYPTMSFKVNFGGDMSGISEDWRSLLQIHEFIAKSVLPRFERFFT